MMSKALVQTLAGGAELPTLKFDTAAGGDRGGVREGSQGGESGGDAVPQS